MQDNASCEEASDRTIGRRTDQGQSSRDRRATSIRSDKKNHQTVMRAYLNYRGATLETILDDNGGAGLGFDVLRLSLAILILLVHSSWIVGTSGVTTSILNFIFHLNPETAPGLAQATMTVRQATITGNPNVHQLAGLGRPITLSSLPMFFALKRLPGYWQRPANRTSGPLSRLAGPPAATGAVCGGDAVSDHPWRRIFTQLPLSQYYASPMFWSYF